MPVCVEAQLALMWSPNNYMHVHLFVLNVNSVKCSFLEYTEAKQTRGHKKKVERFREGSFLSTL